MRLIVGHGPHTPQGVVLLDGALVAYSLGNLSFDCACTNERDAYTLAARFGRDGRLLYARLRPIRAGLGEAPAPADDRELEELLDRLSAELDTRLRREGDGWLRVTRF